IPAPRELAQSLTIHADGQDLTPFYAAATSGDVKSIRGRMALVLIDISGSMNRVLPSGQTRFETAKTAVAKFLDGFENGSDRVAILPFESHRVAETIRSAQFVSTRDQALQQVRDLARPGPKNNTALYSAVSIGLDVVADQMKSSAASSNPPEGMVIVMTDGMNEVFRGDDLGLLAGPSGLEQAAGKVQASGIQVIGVGFGDRGSIDETALRRISTKYYMAEDLASLQKIFTFVRTLLNNRIQAAFSSPWPDRASLAGKTLHLKAEMRMPNGQKFQSNEQVWGTPQMGVPLFEAKCESGELQALVGKPPSGSDSWMFILRPILVFAGLGTSLLILWFWVPRLVWPEQYLGDIPGARWAAQTRSLPVAQKPGRRPPPGFEKDSAAQMAQRTPADPTLNSRTRLESSGREDR
ncbi:MAG: VWA domain-containing protein, partial [Acidobacteriota bacterium]|nr:VWA domain-containing protein [Acidobacteriota bacterium]